MNRKTTAAFLGAAIALAGAANAQQNVSTTFRVSATVLPMCEVRASDLNFGQYSGQTTSQLNGTTAVSVTCTPQATYNIGLNEGTSPGATVNQRKMASGSNALNYQLYQDSSRTKVWGTTIGTDTVAGVGTGLDQDHTVFGAIPAQQVIPAGEYADTITVRIYF